MVRDAMTDWKQLVESAGYLFLGMPDEAVEELDELPPVSFYLAQCATSFFF